MNHFRQTLQGARKARRISQFELALRLGVSQRHVSFVESGRSRPSRELLMSWLQTLDAPLALTNEMLAQAGYAPAYSQRSLSDPELAVADLALGQLLKAHEPAPAFVLDADWNVLRMNSGAQWLAATLLPWAAAMIGVVPVNMLELITHPQGLGTCVTNIHDVGPQFMSLLQQEAAINPALKPRVDAYAAFLATHAAAPAATTRPLRKSPVLTTRFASPHGELAFFSMFTTFGTPNDITLASLRVEHLFPADDLTRGVLERLGSL